MRWVIRIIENQGSKDYFIYMKTMRYVYWQEEDMWMGHLEEYPDYMTQGETLEELQENLKDIYKDLASGSIPHVRHVAELQFA
jgi:hypothetical protein